MPIVFAAPAASAGAGAFQAPSRPMTWTGFDGSYWQLTRPAAVNPRMAPGVKGLHMPRFDVYESSTPLVPGVDLTGYSLGKRSVYWPMLFRAPNADAWAREHGAFFDSFHPVETGVWTVGAGDDARTLPLTGVFDGSFSFRHDPFVQHWALIGIELSAPRPLWRGKPITRRFGADDPVDFIPAEPGDDYFLSPVATFSRAQIPNPGNEPAYLTWTIHGPHPAGVQVGVGGAVIEVPFAVPNGSQLAIDTDPAGQFATLDGDDVTADLGFQMFGPVPPRGESPLTIATGGTGRIDASVTPLYWRAF